METRYMGFSSLQDALVNMNLYNFLNRIYDEKLVNCI